MHITTWLNKGTLVGLTILGVLIGVCAAFGTALFDVLVTLSTQLFYDIPSGGSFLATIEAMPLWRRVLMPTLGGFLVGVIFFVSRVHEAQGEGVPEVEEALAHRRGRIRPIVAPVKIVTAAITLGSGGSAGREGPVIQMGSAIGSSVSQFFKHSTEDRRLLLASGAAAAIGGTFGAPLGGVLFTVEILRHTPSILRSLVIVVAAFIGDICARLISGHEGLRFITYDSLPVSLAALLGLIGLIVACVAVALSFVSILNVSRTVSTRTKLPYILKPAAGGLLVGVTGLFIPYIHEPATYPLMVDLVSYGAGLGAVLMVLLIIKMLGTAVTLSSGGSGGVFAPMLLLGAIVGSLMSTFLTTFYMVDTGSSFVILGMAGVFAAAAHAPLTAAFITYEITQNVSLLIPLIISCLVASALSRVIKKDGIYSIND